MIVDLGGGKQITFTGDYLQTWANRGSIGVQLTPEQMQELGLAMWTRGRRMKREQQCQSGVGS